MGTFTDELKELMTETVTVEPLTGHDGYGSPSYGSASTYTARVVDAFEEQRALTGQIEQVTSIVWIGSTASTFRGDDRVTLPSGEQPLILDIATYRDEDGVTHTKLRLGDRIGAQEVTPVTPTAF